MLLSIFLVFTFSFAKADSLFDGDCSDDLKRILEENAAIRQENQLLRDIIDDIIEDIAEIRGDILSVETEVGHNTESLSSLASTVTLNVKHIRDNSDQISGRSWDKCVKCRL